MSEKPQNKAKPLPPPDLQERLHARYILTPYIEGKPAFNGPRKEKITIAKPQK